MLKSFDDTVSFFFTQLMDYKSSVNKATSVLDYLTRVIITKCPHIAALQDDLKHVEQASQGPYKYLLVFQVIRQWSDLFSKHK